MEKNRIVLFNILKKRTKCILQGLQESNSNLVRDVRDLLQGISGISDEELESIETVDDFWDVLVKKNVISKDDLQILENVAGFVKSIELEKEIKEYKKKSSSGIARTAKLVIKTGLSFGIGMVVLSFCGENEVAKQAVVEKLVLPPLMTLNEVCEGSVCFVVETSSLSSLKQLWTSYKEGSLKEKFKKFISEIDEVRRLTQGTEIDVTVEIDEEEYREACWVLVLAKIIEQAEVNQESSQRVQRPRRHSLSCERDFLPMHKKTQLSWQEYIALKESLKIEHKLMNETRKKNCEEKNFQESRQEIEELKDAIVKSKKEDALNEQTLAPQANDLKFEKLKQDIVRKEEMLKTAMKANDQIKLGTAYYETGVSYYALSTLYKKINEKQNGQDAMKKAESCFREVVDSWEKVNAQLSNKETSKLFTAYGFLTTLLIATKQTEEALIISDHTRDPGLVDIIIKKFQMNEREILSKSMKYGNVSSILGNKSFSILIFAVRQTINMWTLECEKPSFFLEKMLPNEPEPKTSMTNYITKLVASVYEFSNQESLEQLYELLIAPVLSNLTQDDLVIIADGFLHMVPFAALRNPKTGHFLSDMKCIRCAPSLTAMKVWKECPVDYHGNKGALIVGDPDVVRVTLAGEEFEFPSLQFARREAMVVGAILNTSPLIGPQATKDEVLKKLQDRLAVIHIVAMGNERGDIILAPSASTREVKVPEKQDYLLTREEVREMRIRAKLVVLSVSNSGYGEITMGKVNSMSRAFLAAGARAVVASLWGIDWVCTRNFMVSFYTYLKMGNLASKSLQMAMNGLREDGYEEPKYWAPFFLIGDDVTISV